MSLASWKKEFFPTGLAGVENATPENAIERSLQKWRGLTRENIKKHKLDLDGEILSDGADSLDIDGSTCALCSVYYNENDDRWDPDLDPCRTCPLSAVLGMSCDVLAYPHFLNNGDPEPMIGALKQALFHKKKRLAAKAKKALAAKKKKAKV